MDPRTKAQIITTVWTRGCSLPFYLDVMLICPFGGLRCSVVILYFWSLAKEIAVLFTAVVWDEKTCGRTASSSRLDDANSLLMVVM